MKTKKLHSVQEKLLALLIKNQDDPLTIREIQRLLNISSTSIVAHHLSQLEKKGYLKRNPYDPRDYQVKGTPEKQIIYLNLYGLAHCGPKDSILESSPVERIPISTRLLAFSSSEAFLVKAKGESMKPKINDGDLIIARKTKNAENGCIVICINNGEALIKKFQKTKSEIILESLNSSYAPFLASKDFRIEGEVKGIITNKIE